MGKKDEELKAGKVDPNTAGDNKEPKTTEQPKAKTIEVDADTLRKLLESNEKLTAKIDALESNAVATQPNNGMIVRRKAKESDVRLRKWNDKYVVGMVNVGNEKRPRYVYDIIDKETRKAIQYCDLILEDGSIVKEVVDIDFRRDAETVPNCRIISKVEHEDVKEYGLIPKKDMAENGYGMFETMVLVPVEVITKSYTFTLQVPERAEPLEISSEWVNM